MVQSSGSASINPYPQDPVPAWPKDTPLPPIEQQFGGNSGKGDPSLNYRPQVAFVGEASRVGRQCGKDMDHSEHRDPSTIESHKAPASVTGLLGALARLQRPLSEAPSLEFRSEVTSGETRKREEHSSYYIVIQTDYHAGRQYTWSNNKTAAQGG
ncbi:hypothetical protein DL765_007625 [Monosporascus sp. GIB2]|nr:hypothetical protein DL765_007625 [Monosporascus sp. GIB2]